VRLSSAQGQCYLPGTQRVHEVQAHVSLPKDKVKGVSVLNYVPCHTANNCFRNVTKKQILGKGRYGPVSSHIYNILL
jgi:hypothetical protein